MSLQNDTRMILHAGAGRLANQHISNLILECLQTETLAVGHQEISNLFAFSARTRNLCQAVETGPQTLWLKAIYHFVIFHFILYLVI